MFFAFSRLGLDQSLKKPYVNTDTLACYGGLCDLIEGLIVIENTVISKSSYLDYIVALQKACTYEDIKIDQLQLLQLFLRDKNIFVDFKKVYAQLDELTSGNPFYWIENDNKQKTIKKVSAIHELLESWDDFCMNAMVLQKIVRNLSKEGDRHSPNELKQIHFIHQDMEIKDIKKCIANINSLSAKEPPKITTTARPDPTPAFESYQEDIVEDTPSNQSFAQASVKEDMDHTQPKTRVRSPFDNDDVEHKYCGKCDVEYPLHYSICFKCGSALI